MHLRLTQTGLAHLSSSDPSLLLLPALAGTNFALTRSGPSARLNLLNYCLRFLLCANLPLLFVVAIPSLPHPLSSRLAVLATIQKLRFPTRTKYGAFQFFFIGCMWRLCFDLRRNHSSQLYLETWSPLVHMGLYNHSAVHCGRSGYGGPPMDGLQRDYGRLTGTWHMSSKNTTLP